MLKLKLRDIYLKRFFSSCQIKDKTSVIKMLDEENYSSDSSDDDYIPTGDFLDCDFLLLLASMSGILYFIYRG